MSNIDGTNLLSNLQGANRTQNTYPVPRVTGVKEKLELPKEEEKLISEEKSRDRYENYDPSLASDNKASIKSLNQQSEALTSMANGPGNQQVTDLMAGQSLEKAQEQTLGVSSAIVKTETTTVATRTRDTIAELNVDFADLQEMKLNKVENPTLMQKPVNDVKAEAVKMEPEPGPQAIEQQAAHKVNPEHTQNAHEYQQTQDIQDRDIVTMDPLSAQIFEEPEKTTADAQIDKKEYTKEVEKKEPFIEQPSATEKQSVEYEKAVEIELQAKMKARTEVTAKIPTAPEPPEIIDTPVVVEPKFDTVVADQQIKTGAQPSVASIATDGAINEAVAAPQAMLEQYAPAEIQTQPEAEIDIDTPVDTTTKYTHETYENRYTEERVEYDTAKYEAPKPVSAEHSAVQESQEIVNDAPKSQVEEREQAQSAMQEAPQFEPSDMIQSEAAQQGAAGQSAQATVQGSEEQLVQQDLPAAEEFFAPLPGTGGGEGGETDVKPAEDYFAPLPGSGNSSSPQSDVPAAGEFFAPLPGSGNTAEFNTESKATSESHFAPLPGSGEYSGEENLFEAQSISDFMEENQVAAQSNSYETFEETFDVGTSTITAEQLAYMQTGVADTSIATLDNQFGATLSGKSYDPFESIGDIVQEDWVQDAINREVNHRAMVNVKVGEETNLSQFEEQYAETEEMSIEMEEYLRAQFDRVTEYDIKDDMRNHDLKDLFT